MNEHRHISKERVIEFYQKWKSIGVNIEEDERPGEGFVGDTLVKHASSEDYRLYTYQDTRKNNKTRYYIYNEIENIVVWAEEENIGPKSIREKLHNIEKNKRFYERTSSH